MKKNIQNQFKLAKYYATHKKIFLKPSPATSDFLVWFIGFVEGDGSFFIHKQRNQMVFSITQKDILVLKVIKKQLGFGQICFNGGPQKNCFLYNVSSYKGIICLIALFNGNIVLNKVQKRFKNWLEYYNTTLIFSTYFKKTVLFNSKKPIVSYCDAWVSGFSQAEGGFYVGLGKQKNRHSKQLYSNYRLLIKYHVSQKNELETLQPIRNLFYEQILIKKAHLNMTSMKYILTDKRKSVQQLHLGSRPFLIVLICYFNKYPLYGIKKRQYHQWKRFVQFKLLPNCHSELKLKQLKRLITIYRKTGVL